MMNLPRRMLTRYAHEPSSNPVVHLELHTGDLPLARALYGELCGWQSDWIETGAGSYLSLEVAFWQPKVVGPA
jgi:hypothetical protein